MNDAMHVLGLLSEYLEDGLAPGERRRVTAHLSHCEGCARALEEIQDVVGQARSLRDRAPRRDLWPAIETELAPHPVGQGAGSIVPIASRRRTLRLSIPQAIAAGLALVVASGAGVWALRSPLPPTGGPTGSVSVGPAAAGRAPSPLPVELAADVVSPEVSDEIARLERELADNTDRLEASTLRVIVRNLEIIDRAIAESLEALRADPGSAFFREHLDAAVQRKADYLRRAVLGPVRSS